MPSTGVSRNWAAEIAWLVGKAFLSQPLLALKPEDRPHPAQVRDLLALPAFELEDAMAIGSIGTGFSLLNMQSMPSKLPILSRTIDQPTAGAPTASTTSPSSLRFAEEVERLREYRVEREAAFKQKYGDAIPDKMVAVAMPVNAQGQSPFVTADQQRLIDRVTDKYIGRTDFSGLMEELTVLGVNPFQLAEGAEFYIGDGGQITDREGRPLARYVDILT
jgi:hypothetical protein